MSPNNVLLMTHSRPRVKGLSMSFLNQLSRPPLLSQSLVQPQILLPSTQPEVQQYTASPVQSSRTSINMASIYLTKYTSCG